MTTATPTTTFRRSPLMSLARAEFLQFRRNKTLVVTGVIFPVLLPVATYLLLRSSNDGRVDGDGVAATFDMFALFALMFVQYYTVLSMVTTRRSEGVLKRLRTGEATDWQILAAPNAPGVLVTTASSLLVCAIVYATGAPGPVNVLAMIIALVGGSAVFGLLALATSGFTKNAEAAQITSLPVMALAMAGMGNIRSTLPDRAADLLGWTPYAAVSDLMHLGAAGKTATAGTDAPTTDFAGTFTDIGRPVATLVIWTAIAIALVYKGFRWDDRG
ncbi:ABC transporter permease [Gordonia sp. HY285]|uniref:ABC transporter permease n=1 Tax=Gordonia liuliyuniae TaxID=2911517 RepID=UPI001F2C8346|nr:ABC transporter permease [Gordonia liuliyuniae]MCF8609112.1 ABC transporter permease [Gordonia liuliyuniae]